jgi:hypothetical protein
VNVCEPCRSASGLPLSYHLHTRATCEVCEASGPCWNVPPESWRVVERQRAPVPTDPIFSGLWAFLGYATGAQGDLLVAVCFGVGVAFMGWGVNVWRAG